jgi:hypothetical protein
VLISLTNVLVHLARSNSALVNQTIKKSADGAFFMLKMNGMRRCHGCQKAAMFS